MLWVICSHSSWVKLVSQSFFSEMMHLMLVTMNLPMDIIITNIFSISCVCVSFFFLWWQNYTSSKLFLFQCLGFWPQRFNPSCSQVNRWSSADNSKVFICFLKRIFVLQPTGLKIYYSSLIYSASNSSRCKLWQKHPRSRITWRRPLL